MDLAHDAFTVTYDAGRVGPESMARTIRGLGFAPRMEAGPRHGSRREAPAVIPSPIAEALDRARDSGRILLVDFFAAWCVPCRVLEEQVLPDPRVRRALEGYETVRVDTDAFPEAGKAFGIASLPSLLILDATGREIDRLDGSIDAVRLASRLEAAAGQRVEPGPSDRRP